MAMMWHLPPSFERVDPPGLERFVIGERHLGATAPTKADEIDGDYPLVIREGGEVFDPETDGASKT